MLFAQVFHGTFTSNDDWLVPAVQAAKPGGADGLPSVGSGLPGASPSGGAGRPDPGSADAPARRMSQDGSRPPLHAGTCVFSVLRTNLVIH